MLQMNLLQCPSASGLFISPFFSAAPVQHFVSWTEGYIMIASLSSNQASSCQASYGTGNRDDINFHLEVQVRPLRRPIPLYTSVTFIQGGPSCLVRQSNRKRWCLVSLPLCVILLLLLLSSSSSSSNSST